MKKILIGISVLTSLVLSAHSHHHDHIKFSEKSLYASSNAISTHLELGKTEDGDFGVLFEDLEAGVELEQNKNLYFTKDLRTKILKLDENKIYTEIIVPFFDLSLFRDNFKRGLDFHTFKEGLHLHVNIDPNKKTLTLGEKVFEVNIEKTNDSNTIYTEKNGKFVFTTYVDPKGKIQAFATLVATATYEKEDEHNHMHEHHHDHK